MLVGVLAEGRRHGLVEVGGKGEVLQVDELELGTAVGASLVEDPFRDLVATRPGRVLPMMIPILSAVMVGVSCSRRNAGVCWAPGALGRKG